MLKKTLLAAVIFGLSTTALQAYELKSYVTVSVGQAKADKSKAAKVLRSEIHQVGSMPGVSSRTSSDRSDTAYKIGLGLQANEYVALEFQYLNLGEASYKGVASHVMAPSAVGSAKFKSETSGVGANIVGSYPIEDFTVFAKAGYHYLKTKNALRVGVSGVGVDSSSLNKTVREWVPSFGIGASYSVTPELAVIAEYERYQGVANKKLRYDDERVSLKHNVDLASVGVRYEF
ncbi:outer membrane beta-barrel protein [Denitrificimonas sp. JX-1]|uniref:Outer membrane beta-barrel protein n=1 Tax=Denitrificimonas halotolerans TaxID=3098930 RepID=A0ABU5GTZ9_9GAMM|nr:outer membrane beta-barrel protein [Denitrificimonas sp. JX-1]MDY7220460.1 outer membrane beta-barrel protein [Denitrificimonas sp. JX-1]